MQAIVVRDRDAGIAGLSLTDLPYPHVAENDVIVRVHAAGFTPGELDWPATWTDRAGRARTPSVPGHERVGSRWDTAAPQAWCRCWRSTSHEG
jgi:D-arabinose 1-dehydrogenase-like Zn-dependent alcohol dehydrogenase